jgi:hypothetical protein
MVHGARLEGFLTGNTKKLEALIKETDGDKVVMVCQPQ